jgi:valyl-tRNA synthetase
MAPELPKTYDPKQFEGPVAERWLQSGAFEAVPDQRARERRYVVMMPLPNVTGALHMGHAMNNVMQDLLVRWHRMAGANTLWQPGTDHAGIATQAVVEKRLFELEGKTRHDLGREALVERIWGWKDEYQQRIVQQQREMGCSCDWNRQRFTMDAVCSAAVREAFYRLFSDRLIYRGDRLVNWDCQLQTAVSDDEVYHDSVQGYFWHLRYPVVDPEPGEPEYVVVATTRPETMLGDTAVACHPEPAAELARRIAEQRDKAEGAPAGVRAEEEAELERLEERLRTHGEALEQLAAMARAGRRVRLPLMEREIPLIVDEWAKPELGSGCVKITPAHDQNDYEVWLRHSGEIAIINILEPDGTLNANGGSYAGLDRFEAREQVVEDLQKRGLIDRIEDWPVEVGHSDRSKTPIEPYLSHQWFLRMGDVEGGILCGRGSGKELRSAGLAQAAIDATREDWQSPSGLRLDFHPARYRSTYVSWLAEKRDWCISRQLWWGHRIPVWLGSFDAADSLRGALEALPAVARDVLRSWVADRDGLQLEPEAGVELAERQPERGPFELQVCLRDAEADARHASALAAIGLRQDPDVLDTWFSSALWPESTLGWPDPERAPIEPGQTPLGGVAGQQDSLACYYPGSCLVTSRDIITLWVVRMVVMGLYNLGDLPFSDVFVHAKILDGKGVTMSKSRGNGIDPADIIERYGADAMRYLICELETGTQDARLGVQAECPSCGEEVELAEARHGQTIFTYLCTACSGEFDVLGTMPDVPAATIISDRFEVGKNFCNKLWNAARFALMNLGELEMQPLELGDLADEDRWILSRLGRAAAEVTRLLEAYNPSAALGAARDFFWGEVCDWYLELIKPRLRDEAQAPVARQVLAVALDQVLRLLHPFVPFITEAIWGQLNAQAPQRGVGSPLPPSELCIRAAWPEPDPSWQSPELEREFELLREVIRHVRDLRSSYTVPPSSRLPCAMKARGDALASLRRLSHHAVHMARLSELALGDDVPRPPGAATHVLGDLEIYLGDVLDPEKERERLERRREKLVRQLDQSRRKLANPKFVSRAPPEVVETERRRATEVESELKLLEENVRALQGI